MVISATRKCINELLLTYLLSCLLDYFLPSLFTYIGTINVEYKDTLNGNFSQTTITKSLKFCHGIFNCYDRHKN